MDSPKSASYIISVVVHRVGSSVGSDDAIVLTKIDDIIHVPRTIVMVDNDQAEMLYEAILLLKNYKGYR
jgi:hypothetical protein